MPESLPYPFPRVTRTLPTFTRLEGWWRAERKLPIVVEAQGDRVKVLDSQYFLLPQQGGFLATRPGGSLPLGRVLPDGVRDPLGLSFFHELSAARALIFGKTYPAPIAYEMSDRSLVHPGDCFRRHPRAVIYRTKYTLAESTEALCATCGERFL